MTDFHEEKTEAPSLEEELIIIQQSNPEDVYCLPLGLSLPHFYP
jgi:hypothetical protein